MVLLLLLLLYTYTHTPLPIGWTIEHNSGTSGTQNEPTKRANKQTNNWTNEVWERERARECVPRALVCVYVSIAPLMYKTYISNGIHTLSMRCHCLCMWKRRRPPISIDKNSFLFVIKDFLVAECVQFTTAVSFLILSLSLSHSCSLHHFCYVHVCDLLGFKRVTEWIRKALNSKRIHSFNVSIHEKSGFLRRSIQRA